MGLLKLFYEEEDGSIVVELVLVIATLLAVALLFRKQIFNFAKGIMEKVFNPDLVTEPGTNG